MSTKIPTSSSFDKNDSNLSNYVSMPKFLPLNDLSAQNELKEQKNDKLGAQELQKNGLSTEKSEPIKYRKIF